MRLAACLLASVAGLAACGGNGGDGDGAFSLSPTSGSPGDAITVTPPCEEPPLTAEWVSPTGFSSYVASDDSQSRLGLTSVPGDVGPGTYTVIVTCATRPAPVGQAMFDVTE